MNNERAKEHLEEMRVEYFCGSGAYDALGLAINSLDRDISILKALEDVRAEIDTEYKRFRNKSDKWDERASGIGTALEIIDRKIAEVTKNE